MWFLMWSIFSTRSGKRSRKWTIPIIVLSLKKVQNWPRLDHCYIERELSLPYHFSPRTIPKKFFLPNYYSRFSIYISPLITQQLPQNPNQTKGSRSFGGTARQEARASFFTANAEAQGTRSVARTPLPGDLLNPNLVKGSHSPLGYHQLESETRNPIHHFQHIHPSWWNSSQQIRKPNTDITNKVTKSMQSNKNYHTKHK